QANGGAATGCNAGGGGGRIAVYYSSAAGYTGFAGSTVSGGTSAQAGTAIFADTSLANPKAYIYQNYVLPADSQTTYDSITVTNGANLTMGGGSQLTLTKSMTLSNNSTVTVLSKNNTGLVGGFWKGVGGTIQAANLQIDSGSSITADGQGYLGSGCSGPGDGPGGGQLNCDNSGNAGSYGGAGGGPNQATATTYGSANQPTDLGSGGSGGYASGAGQAGGGAIRLMVTGTLTNNGLVTANGIGVGGYAGAGSGGSIYATATTLAGTGVFQANGGGAPTSTTGGGGGRTAIYYYANNGFNQASATANGENSGQNGTVVFSNTPQFQWVTPASGVSVLHGSNTLSWSADAVNFSTYSVTLTISGPLAFTAGTNLSPLGSYQWDTTTAPDGRYDLRLVFYDANGNDIKELPRTVVVNNSVVWHSGTITANQEWTADKVQGLDGIVTIPSGVTVTIDPGTVVKALPGAQIVVQSGGILNALGGSSNPVIFTVFNDSSVGGDTDFSNGQSVPSPGEWNGISVQSGGVFNSNANTEILYVSSSQAGTLPTSETWMSNQLYVVTGNLIVPSGATLTLQPGTIVKFDAGAGITVQAGAQLLAQGTEAQPIYFTSLKDDSIGGDTNGDGDATSPAAGDWGSITISGTGASAAFNHVQIFYGGGPVSASYQLGMVETGSGATVTIDNSILAKSFWTGIWTGATGGGDTVTISNSLLYGISERAVNAWGGSIVHLVNDTFDNNAVAIMQHGGSIDMANSILTNCLGMNGWNACVQGSITAAYSDVWANQANIANYSTGDPTGTNGNISADPVYVNATQHDYRLNFGSPAIDAANGLAANYLTTDLMGDPRYNDPEVTTKAGVADANGNYPDMGAYEFVQSAASNVNLTVSAVNGPSTALTGSQVQLTWIDTNTGSGVAQGPWHDAIYLVRDPDTNPVAILAGEVLVASNVTLGPGASTTATGTIRVPGSIVGNHRWEVKANDRGEVFVGANAVNNTGISLDTVAIDLPELDLDAAASPASFSASGQSSWYKFTPGANQSVTLDLALNSINGSPSTGSVQLFVGQGYVPTPQHFDYQQVEWNSPTASTVVPNTSSQTYYVTAYAQSLPATPAAFTLAASTVHFSLTAVQPSTITIQPTSLVKPGPVTVTFMGGGFTSNATYQLVDANSKIYSASSVFVSDSTQASVTFAMADIPAGSYTAQVTEGSSTVSLTNALTVTAVSASTSGQQVQVNLVAPQEFRTGFPETVTLNYSNVSGADVPAPLIWLTATNATLSEIAPQCAGCSTNFTQQYNNTFTSGLVLGINSQGPAGVLPAGAQGSIQFQALPTGGEVTFTLKYINGVEAVNTWYGVIFQGYDADHAAAFCNTLLPSFDNALGFSRTCMQLLNNASYKFVPGNGEFSQPIPGGVAYFPDGGYLDVNGFNGLLAADATALSLAGTYESDATRILGFELQKDGLSIFNQRYHQGAFGYGKSHPFDITAQLSGGLPTVFSPNGSARVFPVQNPNQTGQYFGTVGDYGTLTIAADGSWMVTERNGVSKHFIADPVSNANSRHLLDFIQDLNGNRITLTYTNDLVSSVTDSVGNAISYTYDSLGHITQSTDPEGRITTYAYDIKSDRLNSTFLTSVTNASGTTTIAWNEGGPSGVGYFQDLCVTTYCEPAIGVSSITYPDKTHTYFTYDSLGRLTSKYRDGNTETESFTYDSTGAVTATDATGNAVRIAPDEEGGVAQFTDPLLAVTQFSYDAEHKLTRMEEPLGTGYSISYDTQGNPIALLDPLGNQTSMAYTSYGRLQSLTDPNGNATSYNYDSHSNRTAINYSDGSAEQFSYDSFGNLIKWTNRRGNSITFTYDAHNLLLTKTYASGAQISYTYDNHRNLLTATSSSGSTTFTYDSADRLTSVTYPNGKAIQYTYNSLGQRSSQQDSTGFTVNYSYDSVGRLAQLTNSTGAVIVTYTYNAAGRLATKTLGNGTHTTQAYDANGNLLHLIHYSAANAVLSEFDYTYDALGRRISATTPAGAWTYSYDADGQLTSVTLPSASAQYTYDANGNRLSAVTSGSASNYNVNNLNEYSAAGSSVYRYDADGNLVSGGGWTYTYDDENRLTAMANSTDTWSFQYDALGNRASSTHNGSVTQYLNDPSGSGNVEAEFDGSGNLLSHFTYGLGLTSMVPAGGAADYYHFDGSGNTAQLTNATGSIINSYTFLPFGEPIASTAGVANPFTYHAQSGAMDDGSGIYLLAGRWYSPQLGRFMQQSNSATTGGNSNPYTFAKNAPGKTPPIALGIPARDTGKATNQSKLSRPGSNGAVQKSATLDIQKNASKNGIGVCIGQDCPDNGDDGVIIEEVEPEDPPVDPPVIIAENPDDWPLDDDLDQLSDDLAWWDALSDLLDDETEQYTFEDLVKYGWTLGLKDVKDAWTWFNHDFDNDPLFDGQPEEDDDIPVGGSKDPNGKITSGFGDQGYIPTGVPITYTIYFENQSSATAPAQIVTVTDPLAANLDWSSVQLNQIEFNNVTITVPNGAQSYTGQVSVSTDPNPVNVTAALNPTTGVLGWKMQSVNPVTGGLPADPLAGFLPPNNASNQGTGFVTFSVMPKTGLANGATITNQASIVFDVNAAIATNTVTNTIDSVYPTSSVASLPAITTTTTFPVSWSGSDPAGAGIASYSIFVSVNSGYYSLWLPSTTATSSTYTGALGTTYSFYSMATDNVGLSQQAAGQVQTISVMGSPTVTVKPNPSSISAAQALTVTVSVAGGSGNPTPTGSVTLSGGGYTSTAQPLSGGSFVFTVPANSLSAGIDTLTASYNGDTNYTSMTGTATVTVAAVPLTPTVTVSPKASTTDTGSSLSVPVTVTGAGAMPTGTVTLAAGSYTSTAEPLTSGAYTFTIPANSLSAPSATITVTYSGDAIYATNTGTASVTVTASIFSLAATTPVAVAPGSPATSTITVSTTTEYAGSVTVACALTSSPANATDLPTCSAGSSTVNLSSAAPTGTTTVTVTTTGSGSASLRPVTGRWAGGAALALLLFLGIPARRRGWSAMLGLLLLLAAMGTVSGCGGSSSSSGQTGTTAGNYTFTVTGTGSPSVSPAPTTTFTLTVN
ncbi:MAG: Ig-like domain repeat protein, partial [Terracidiphilus sp.]